MANKPWLKKNDEKVIEVMGAKITLKKLTFGESRKAVKEAMKFNPITQKAEVDPSLIGVLRALYQIKDWDLTDENDNKLPITLETLDSLHEDFVAQLIQKISEQDDNGVTEEEKKQ
jgi:hypothetical protein